MIFKMEIKLEIYNNWKDLKTKLFYFYLFSISIARFLDYYRISFCLFGFEFMIEIMNGD